MVTLKERPKSLLDAHALLCPKCKTLMKVRKGIPLNAAVDEAHHRVSAAGFKYYGTEMVCWATGGPQNYTGR
jgi:hypothetical protein